MDGSSSTAAVLLLDLPPQSLGGIDLLAFTTTPKFVGIKNLPAGFHFVFTGATSSLSVRHGAWVNVKFTGARNEGAPPDLFVKKWDAASESLLPETDVAQILRWRANLGSIWREGLTPYRQSATQASDTAPAPEEYETSDWAPLTAHITPALLSRILAADPDYWTLTSASSAAVDVDDIPGISATEGRTADERELHFLPIDLRRTWREGATGRERTEAAQDRSWYLADLASKHCATTSATGGADSSWDEVIGELEFCFLMVLTLNNYSCLEQWRRLLAVVLTCKSAIATHPAFFARFLNVLPLQLQHCDDVDGGGLFDLAEEGATFFKPLLARFRKSLDEIPGTSPGKQAVVEEFDDLLDYLHDSLGWNVHAAQQAQMAGEFARSGTVTLEDGEEVDMDDVTHDEDDEFGEYAPQIVDLSPEQMKELGFGEEGGASLPVRKGKSLRQTLRDEDAEDEDELLDGEDAAPLYEDDEEDPEAMDARF